MILAAIAKIVAIVVLLASEVALSADTATHKKVSHAARR